MKQKRYSEALKIPFAVLIIFAFLILGGWFYWFEYRPSMIIEACSTFAEKEANKDLFVYEIIYRHCLRKNGMEHTKSEE
jgi:hypothetical protein